MKTTTIKKVLIATDYSETAKTVVEKGYSLAKAMNAETILLHIISEYPVYYSGYSYMSDLNVDPTSDSRKYSEDYLKKLKKRMNDDSIITMVKDGIDIAKTILQVGKDQNVDLIVLGTHSRKWLENIIMGSEVEEVLRKTNIPLYIVPTKKL